MCVLQSEDKLVCMGIGAGFGLHGLGMRRIEANTEQRAGFLCLSLEFPALHWVLPTFRRWQGWKEEEGGTAG